MKPQVQTGWCRIGWAALVAVLMLAVAPDVGASGLLKADPNCLRNPPVQSIANPPAGVSENAWAKILRQIKEDQYRFSKAASAEGGEEHYRALNRANGLRASFKPEGIEILPLAEEKSSWNLKMHLASYGFKGALKDAPSAFPEVASGHLKYLHGEVTEWYRNDEHGLEQGFTIEEPPGDKEGGELILVLLASGTLTPKGSEGTKQIVFHDPNGRVALRYGNLSATDASGKPLPMRLSLSPAANPEREREIKIAVETTKAHYPITVDPLFTTEIKLTRSDPTEGDHFGCSVAISGDTVVVGAYCADYVYINSGSAYIFSRNSGGADNWGLVKKLTVSDPDEYDFFGWSVAISGDTVVVGAYGDDYESILSATRKQILDTVVVGAYGDDDAGYVYSGAAYIFSRNSGGANKWGEVKKLTASDVDEYDFFGYSVAISGDTVVVGAKCILDGKDSGAAYIFSRNSGGADNWGEMKKLTASDPAARDYFGCSVAISGDTVVVGAYGDDDAGYLSGSAYIFSRNSGGANKWGEVKKLTASDTAEGDFFGGSVAISGDTVVVGAYYNDAGYVYSGAAYIFSRNSGGADYWGQVQKLTASDAADLDYFGCSVAISGDTVVVGASWSDDAGYLSGSAYIFSRNYGGANKWEQVKKLTASDAAAEDHFGYSVSISGNTVVVGAYGDDVAGYKNSGSAYLYTLDPGHWAQQKKHGATSGALGWSTAVTENMLAVGAPNDGTNGAVYLFYRNNGTGPDTWEQKLKITGYASGEKFGSAVSLDKDKLAVGAPYNDNAGSDYGAAYIFYRNLGGPDYWHKVETLTASDTGGLFGWSVSLSGDKLAVGAPANFFTAGAAYLFYRNTGGIDKWGEVKRICASDPFPLNQFGWALSLDNDKLAVGAPFNSSNKGAVYIFYRNHGTPPNDTDNWGFVKKKTADLAEVGDHFGYAVSLSHDQLVVGAPDEDSQGTSSGAAYVYYRNYGGSIDNWGQVEKILAPDGGSGKMFGWAVANECDRALVSAGGGGAVYILERNAGGGDHWGSVQKLTPSDTASQFGFSLDMCGNNMAIGAGNAIYVFQRKIKLPKAMPWLLLLLLD